MARRRFFVPEIHRGTAELTGADADHLVRVLRAEVGQVYEISDNENLYLAEIEVARKSVVTFRIQEKLAPAVPSVSLTLAAALFKFDHFEWLVEKATELGVAAIQPLEATRTERGLAQASGKRRNRWERIALEASQQSRRAHLPVIHPTVRLAKALEVQADIRLLLDEAASAPPILGQLPDRRSASDRVSLLLGPEGGWTEEERTAATSAGWLPCSLGPAILRAETAGVAGLAVLQAAWSAKPAVE
ncbi:MAG TPA: RsmE family RNA methyltransferase [Bryobacteraceae bacterium]|nr:RsmE family RNA methyltransferase [Bryobacteraceae bacterium]